jgi:dipeptidyl aminopeptidase/acylaminoacyl peptidase
MSRPIADYLEMRAAFAVDVASDGSAALVVSNLSGTMQLYRLPLATRTAGASAPPLPLEQLTDLAEPVSGRFLPGSQRVVVSVDRGGNERHQLHLLDGPGAPLRPLVVDPEHIHRLGGVSMDGRRIAYATNRRNGVDFDIVVHDLTTGAERCVFDRGGWCEAGGFSPDGRWLAVLQATELTMDNELYLCELGTGEVLHVSPHQGDARFGEPAWLGDGGFVFASDADREFTSLARYDLATRSWRYLRESAWDESCWTDLEGGRLLVARNEDGLTRLEVLAAESLALIGEVPLPGRGVAGGDSLVPPPPLFVPGTQAALLGYSGAAEPGDVWLAEPGTAEPRRLTRSPRSVPEAECVEPTLHRFASFDGETVSAFVYRPAPGQRPAPVVVLVHGGPESQYTPVFNPVVQYLVSRGYAVVAPNVRGSTGYGKRFHHLDDGRRRLDSVRDLAALHAWLPSVGLDQRRAALYGGSYGGYMVLSGLAFQPELWAAGVDVVGISSLVTFLENTAPWRRRVREREYGSLERDYDFLLEASPLTHVERIRAPLLLIHGSNDPRVPLSEAEQIHRVLTDKGIPCELLVYADEGHGLAKLANRLDAYPRVVAFLDRVLNADG